MSEVHRTPSAGPGKPYANFPLSPRQTVVSPFGPARSHRPLPARPRPVCVGVWPKHCRSDGRGAKNFTLRMRNCRFTRLTNAFGKKIDDLEHSVALHIFADNFTVRPGTPRVRR